MCGLVMFMVDTAAALAKYITEQERGNGGGLTSCSCLLLKSLVDFWLDLPNHLSIRWEGDKKQNEQTLDTTLAHHDWSGRQDSNLRPPGPKPGALPDCATPRIFWFAGAKVVKNIFCAKDSLDFLSFLTFFIAYQANKPM